MLRAGRQNKQNEIPLLIKPHLPGPNSTLNLHTLKHKHVLAAMLLIPSIAFTQGFNVNDKPAGTFSLGTRNTVSMFNEDEAIGKGIGGQFRVRLGNRLNSEWFFDYIASKNGSYTYRNDYHIGWSLMFYMGNNFYDDQLLQPYFLLGHCFDKSKVADQSDKTNAASRVSMATQAGLGTHININPRFDCSLSAQYMLHFGKDIKVNITEEGVTIEKADFTHADGHLLFTISFNYKLFHLWKSRAKD
jgi:hypothetical protein